MIEKLIIWSVRNRFLVILVTLFVVVAGLVSISRMPLDAIPDLSDVQVIVYTDVPGQAPQVVEDQVTYPLTTAMLSVPYAKSVRGYSFFGLSFVYIIFEDGTDIYWARSRVLEYLNVVAGRLPEGVTPALGPDATGVGWVYEYVLKDSSGALDNQQLRSLQDWYLRYELTAVSGVSEVASIGGFVKQYQVEVDPSRLNAYNLSIDQIRSAIKRSNTDVGGRLVEMAETEFMVRGLGYLSSVEDLEKVSLGVDEKGTPILLKHVARVKIGPELRRGVLEWNGEGEVVGGIVVMRYGENALATIERVKKRLKELEQGLPEGVTIEAGYDRSGLIERAVSTLKVKLVEEMAVVALICVIFLLHFRSAFVAIFTLPVGILIAFTVMYLNGINANIMSLGGIAIAIGVMVDASVVLVENAHKHMERNDGTRSHQQIIIDASREVGPALFYSLLIITVSFLPVFTLVEQSGRLFRPLAYTKTFAMAASSVLAVTVIPVLMTFFVREKGVFDAQPKRRRRLMYGLTGVFPPLAVLAARSFGVDLPVWSFWGAMIAGFLLVMMVLPQRILSEKENPLSRFLIRIYRPVIHGVLSWRKLTIAIAVLILAATWFPFSRLGSEFMPPLNEGDLLYMPTTLPGISVTKARELLQQTDKIIKRFPEVRHVLGKVGRAETSTDPAPLSMIETTIVLRPKVEHERLTVDRFYDGWPGGLVRPLSLVFPKEKEGKILHEWRKRPVDRFFSDWPSFLSKPLAWVLPEERYMTLTELSDELNEAVRFPGLTNAWTMPIRTRIDMLSTGIKTPVGIKIMGTDLSVLSDLGTQIEALLRPLNGTLSVYSERVAGGKYLDIAINRDHLARFGLSVDDVQKVIMTAIGGRNITWTVEGLERYPVNLRYSREYRNDLDSLGRVLVPTPSGAHVPLVQLASLSFKNGPAGIKSENARRTAWVYVDLKGVDVGSYVKEAKALIENSMTLPSGYSLVWSGQFEYMEKARKSLTLIVPATLILIFVLLYLHFGSLAEATLVMASLPFALTGGVWLIYWLDYNLSVAVVVGFIALAGLASETGVVMLVYLNEVYGRRLEEGRMNTPSDLYEGVIEGAVDRVRPKLMTVATTLIGLLPVMWGSETGAQIMKRIAAPMVGGLISSTFLTLIIIPAIYYGLKAREMKKKPPVRG
ncbi:efflux RND transporter permease subunit [Desulfoluna sp.]|uniref:efflux RND transporter permease subunit n=1 Tax=Desulfoluna sp. TaxID=2045199 RepID=UPI002619E662|nr:efflux RND transporter permease subunit [Desulfoluna sp.]